MAMAWAAVVHFSASAALPPCLAVSALSSACLASSRDSAASLAASSTSSATRVRWAMTLAASLRSTLSCWRASLMAASISTSGSMACLDLIPNQVLM
jgi:hypothetical protein